MAVAPAGLLVIAFPGGSGTASLLHQAHRLQGLSSLPIELIDLVIASGGRAPPPLLDLLRSPRLVSQVQARATGTSLSRVVAARERWPRRIRQAGARPQAAHCTVPLP